MSLIRKDSRLYVKIVEAKNLSTADACDAFCTLQVEGKEYFRTSTIWGNAKGPNSPYCPYWGEEFTVENDVLSSVLSVVLWKDEPKFNDRTPLGKISFPVLFLKDNPDEEEVWFTLASAEGEDSVFGEVSVKISYSAPKRFQPEHTLEITIINARELKCSNPIYCTLFLLPDAKASSMQTSKHIKNSKSYFFNQTFTFTCAEVRPDLSICIQMWAKDKIGSDKFLGYIPIPLMEITLRSEELEIERTYRLLPLPLQISWTKLVETAKKVTGNSTMCRSKALAIGLQSMVSNECPPRTNNPHKFVDHKAISLQYCGHCNSTVVCFGAAFKCVDCKMVVHVKCLPQMVTNCGGVGMLRAKFRFTESPILHIHAYENMMAVLETNKFLITALLGKVSAEREEAARALVKLFAKRENFLEFMEASLIHEILHTESTTTLFRANSMASKAFDVYMKLVGLPYVKQVLSRIVTKLLKSKKSLEIDPERLEKGEDVKENLRQLIFYASTTFQSIVDTKENMPEIFCKLFRQIRTHVQNKFPNYTTVKYTCITGFLFLRLFSPAILTPKLFGLVEENEIIDRKSARSLTLLAKVLLNIANLAEFGQKEPYMIQMNPFVQSKMDEMRQYIDFICDQASDEVGSTSHIPEASAKKNRRATLIVNVDEEKECSRIYGYFLRAIDRLVAKAEGFKETELVNNLIRSLAEIASILDSFDSNDSNQAIIDRCKLLPDENEDCILSRSSSQKGDSYFVRNLIKTISRGEVEFSPPHTRNIASRSAKSSPLNTRTFTPPQTVISLPQTISSSAGPRNLDVDSNSTPSTSTRSYGLTLNSSADMKNLPMLDSPSSLLNDRSTICEIHNGGSINLQSSLMGATGFRLLDQVNVHMKMGNCHACNEAIETEDHVTLVNSRVFHLECFKCTKCSKLLQVIKFRETNDLPYCVECYMETTKSSPKQRVVIKPITVLDLVPPLVPLPLLAHQTPQFGSLYAKQPSISPSISPVSPSQLRPAVYRTPREPENTITTPSDIFSRSSPSETRAGLVANMAKKFSAQP